MSDIGGIQCLSLMGPKSMYSSMSYHQCILYHRFYIISYKQYDNNRSEASQQQTPVTMYKKMQSRTKFSSNTANLQNYGDRALRITK